MTTGYREPGVYLEVKNNQRYVNSSTIPALIPIIMGSGASKLVKTVSIKRALSGQDDILPSTDVLSIKSVGYSSTVNKWVATTDYTFVADSNKITWVADKGPTPGTNYYITYVAAVESTQFEPRLCASVNDVVSFFGPDIQEAESNTPVCPVSLAAQLALREGVASVYVVQVEPNVSGTVTSVEYQAALDKYVRFMKDVWRIIPVDTSAEINAVIDQHISTYSSPQEKLERTTILATPYSGELTSFSDATNGVLKKVGDYTTALADSRISVVYPDRASVALSNGKVVDVDGAYLAAAFAGAEAAQPAQQSRTRMTLKSIYKLKGVSMTRTEKNRLADMGVLILEQADAGLPVVVRHQLTTDMSSVQTREMSIIAVSDLSAKFLRGICEQYIGKYNITPEVITRISATLKAGMSQLTKLKIINKGNIGKLLQDADNPDTLAIEASILPPYPCNYIDIVMILE